MLPQLEEKELLVLRAPVAADALEDSGPVVKGVGHQAQSRVGVTLDLAVEIHPVLRLLLPPRFSRARGAFCLDRHRQTTSFVPCEQAWVELSANSRLAALSELYARLR